MSSFNSHIIKVLFLIYFCFMFGHMSWGQKHKYVIQAIDSFPVYNCILFKIHNLTNSSLPNELWVLSDFVKEENIEILPKVHMGMKLNKLKIKKMANSLNPFFEVIDIPTMVHLNRTGEVLIFNERYEVELIVNKKNNFYTSPCFIGQFYDQKCKNNRMFK